MTTTFWIAIICLALFVFVAIDMFCNSPPETQETSSMEQLKLWWGNSWAQYLVGFIGLFIGPLMIAIFALFTWPMKIIDESYSLTENRKKSAKTIVVIVEVVLLISLVVRAIVANTDCVDRRESAYVRSTTTASPTYTPAPSESKVIVYVTSSGEKYHRRSCQYLYSSCIEIDLQKAKQKGYDPCSKCNPPH